MTTPSSNGDIEFGGPATYNIVVQGSLGPEWGERMADMAIATISYEGKSSKTTLRGPIRDQAELNGVLETLYGMHLPILKVEKVDDEP